VVHRSTPDDLALHGVRVLGFATAARVAARYGLDAGSVEELLRDFEASGWVRHSSFAGTSGWSVTDGGRAENEQRLAAELDRIGARDTFVAAHQAFLPLNEQLGKACTDWQVRPTRFDPLAFNDHTDWRWDERVLRILAVIDDAFRAVCDRLTACLARFDGYADLYSSARRLADAGQRAWVDAHDLLATLGIPRGSDT
jgi:hypothetical protein